MAFPARWSVRDRLARHAGGEGPPLLGEHASVLPSSSTTSLAVPAGRSAGGGRDVRFAPEADVGDRGHVAENLPVSPLHWPLRNLRFARDKSPMERQPISRMPRSISARMISSARSTPARPAAARGKR
jgi:hypothetical protein